MKTHCSLLLTILLLPSIAFGQVISDDLLWDYHKTSAPGGTAHASKMGDAFEFAISGGTSSTNTVFLGTVTTPSLNFTRMEEGKALKISISQLSITGTTPAEASRVFMLSLTTNANVSPYNDGAKALSFMVRDGSAGNYQLGWKESGAAYPYSKNTLQAGNAQDSIEGIDLILTATTYEFILKTANSSVSLTGDHGIEGDWGSLGLNLLLQKGVAGEYDVSTNIGRLSVEVISIPETSTSMLLTFGTALGLSFWSLRRRSVKGSTNIRIR